LVCPSPPLLVTLSEVQSTPDADHLVVGYGVGPLFLSPISEIPFIGRTTPYIITLVLFCAIQLPTAAVDHIAPFLILRFLAGFVGSPPLATGGESIASFIHAARTRDNADTLQGLPWPISFTPTNFPTQWVYTEYQHLPPLLSPQWSQHSQFKRLEIGPGHSGRCFSH
jgi:hypothetical protein